MKIGMSKKPIISFSHLCVVLSLDEKYGIFFLYFENYRFILIHLFFSKLMTMNENDKTLKNIYLIWLNTRNEELPSGAED